MSHSVFQFPLYSPNLGLSNGHVQSILPTLVRRVHVPFQRSTLELPDGDFLLLDTLRQNDHNAPWVILTHGLEGSSRRHYMQGMARIFFGAGWNVLSWNFRSCGGSFNRLARFYHSGAIEDLKTVIHHVLEEQAARSILLVGFSMGGNQSVLTLADDDLPSEVIGGIGFSVPLDLAACADTLALPSQRIYMKRFLRDLKPKIADKAQRFPDQVSIEDYDAMSTFHEFDERYTAPLHGFRSAQHYWQSCSSKKVLASLRRPTLIVNALNDPFLARSCFEIDPADQSQFLWLDTPRSGGHVGFIQWRLNQPLWSEKKALAFANYLLE